MKFDGTGEEKTAKAKSPNPAIKLVETVHTAYEVDVEYAGIVGLHAGALSVERRRLNERRWRWKG